MVTDDQFIEAYIKNQRQVFCYISTLMPRYDDVEDVFQQFSMVAWKKRADYDPAKGTFMQWFFGIAWYLAQNHRRKDNTRTSLIHYTESLDNISQEMSALHLDTGEISIALDRCLNKLNPDERTILIQVYTGTQKIKDIAEEMEVTPDRLYAMLRRLRRLLVSCITREMKLTEV